MTLVTLHDGRQVSSYSEDWRHECEARFICNMPTRERRRAYLYGELDVTTGQRRGGILQRRGKGEVERLEKTIRALWPGIQAANRTTTGGQNL